jgi:RNA polymerase II subunit A-like phosphatase
MLIRTTKDQHFPITVSKLLVQRNQDVKVDQPLFRYTYTSKVTEGDKYGDEQIIDKVFYEDFKSETAGNFEKWYLAVGDVLTRPEYVITCVHASS